MADKTLADVKRDMGILYDRLISGEIELKAADSAANIAGKFLKGEQLELAREMFMASAPALRAREPAAGGTPATGKSEPDSLGSHSEPGFRVET